MMLVRDAIPISMAILDLEKGAGFADDCPLFSHYSLEQDRNDDFVLEIPQVKNYI